MVEPEAAMCNFVILKPSFSFSAIGYSIMLFAGPDVSGKLVVDDQGSFLCLSFLCGRLPSHQSSLPDTTS